MSILLATFYLILGVALFGGSVRKEASTFSRVVAVIVGTLFFVYGVYLLRVYSCPVTLYSLEGCPHCTNAKRELDRVGLRYREVTYYRGMKNPPTAPDGTVPNSFPQLYTKDGNMGSYRDIATWAPRYR